MKMSVSPRGLAAAARRVSRVRTLVVPTATRREAARMTGGVFLG